MGGATQPSSSLAPSTMLLPSAFSPYCSTSLARLYDGTANRARLLQSLSSDSCHSIFTVLKACKRWQSVDELGVQYDLLA